MRLKEWLVLKIGSFHSGKGNNLTEYVNMVRFYIV